MNMIKILPEYFSSINFDDIWQKISNWPDPVGQNGIWVKIIYFHYIMVIFLETD